MTELMTIVCRYTGIQARIELPTIGRLTLEYTHPLSNVNTALDACQTREFMRRLDAPVLAGILITLLRHKKLLDQPKDHAAAVNAELSKASRAYLLKAIEVVRHHIIPLDSVRFLPKIRFDYYESQDEANKALLAAIGTLAEELFSGANLEEEIKRYFQSHKRTVTFEGFQRGEALEYAREVDRVKEEARKRLAEQQLEEAMARLEAKEAAKKANHAKSSINKDIKSLTKRISRLEHLTLSVKQLTIIGGAAKQVELLPSEKLQTLFDRCCELHSEVDDAPTRTHLEAAMRVFKHFLVESNNSSILDDLETIHEPRVKPAPETKAEPTPIRKEEPKRKLSLLERIQQKRAAK